ncbi:MAG: T9SS type A sorting domain-containing protein [Paludibacter sp.]
MKKNFILIAVALVFVTTKLSAETTLLHYWNFNGTNVPIAADITNKDVVISPLTPISADVTLTSYPASIIYRTVSGTVSAMSYWDLVGAGTGSTLNARNSDVAGDCLRPRDAWTNMELVLNIPTTGYDNPIIMYDVQRSSSGPTVNTYSYSVDGGTSWITTGLSTTTNTVVIPSTGFVTQTVTINNTPANNTANLQFKILFSVSAKGAGNDRIDNITVEGTKGVYNAIEQNQFNNTAINMSPNTTKNGVVNFSEVVDAVVYNVQGKQVKTVAKTDKLITSDLTKGLYVVRINGSTTKKLIIE